MRLFAALVPPSTALHAVVEALATARRERQELRWAPVERMHLTLAFYGDVPDARVDDLRARLARAAARHSAHALAFAGAGAFPSRTRARVFWIGVAGDTDRLVKLAGSAAAAGRRIGLSMEEKKYRPHLTAARAKHPVDVRAQVEELADWTGERWPATEVALVRSRLGPNPHYETLDAWQLA